MSKNEKILVIDDEKELRLMLKEFLEIENYDVLEAENGRTALEIIEKEKPDLILLDLDMPVMTGKELMKELNERDIEIPIIVITGHKTMNNAIDAIRSGAYDYLTKPYDIDEMFQIINRCLEDQRFKAVVEQNAGNDIDQYEMIGNDPEMLKVFKKIGSIARTPNTTTVLVLGESGTGKELVARQLHKWGKTHSAPFIGLNMTAMPDQLLESELFGFEKGAFTGAGKRTHGKFELAGEGTILLDEIGDLSHDLQLKLLRVLQEREYTRIGGYETIPVKGRIVATTNANLEKKIVERTFRVDLYYRLNVVSIHLPALRDRKDDIPLLADHFLEKYSINMSRPKPTLPNETLDFLMDYDWPGNVRQLDNVIAQALVVNPGERIRPSDLALSVIEDRDGMEKPILIKNLKEARRLSTESFERKFIENRLKETKGNVVEASKNAEVSHQIFYRMMKKYGIKADRFK